jgi:hypothetical protein
MPFHVDHVADKSGAELVRLSKQYEFPDFVKKAGLEQTTAARVIPDTVYADPVRKQFPCDTAASTWLSNLYYQEKAAEFHPKDRVKIERRLEHYADYWRIKSACDYIKQRWKELHKSADDVLPDTDFAYVRVADNGGRQRHLRMKSAAEVKAAAEYVERWRDNFPFAVLHSMSKKILEKAARFGAAIQSNREFLEKHAGMGCCDPAEVVQAIEQRARMVKSAELRQQFMKMAATVKESPRKMLQPPTLIKLAETLDTLDRQLNLTHRYAEGLQRPTDVIFKVTFGKVAGDLYNHVSTTSGKLYEKSAFKKIALEDLEGLFGREFAERVQTPLGEIDPEKMAEEVGTLPRPEAELLDGLLADNGITPSLQKAASARHGLSEEEKKAWAAAYATVR